MNIVMFTNTYTPHVGGVARSVDSFAKAYRKRGHRVLVVAPHFKDMPKHEPHVLRIPAIQHFNGSDFSVVLPLSVLLRQALDDFRPQIIHAHHPFLLGMTALREARYRQRPLVFTHHTRYEDYTHYVPGDQPTLKRFIIEAATQYANLADLVFAPSCSMKDLLLERDVSPPIEVIPTGVSVGKFSHGDAQRVRRQFNIAQNDFVVGHVGRLAPEKNIEFLARSVATFITKNSQTSEKRGITGQSHFIVVGTGPSAQSLRDIFKQTGLQPQLHTLGLLENQDLVDALHAMDVFAFASKSETQGMVLTEAMAAKVPVVALDAPGAREVVSDQRNGRLLMEESVETFANALDWVAKLEPSQRDALRQAAYRTAQDFSMLYSTNLALAAYAKLLPHTQTDCSTLEERWRATLKLIKAEWDIIKGVSNAANAALAGGDDYEPGNG